MRSCLLLGLLLLVSASRATDSIISMNFNNAPVNEIFEALAEYEQLNLVIAPEVEGALTLHLREVPWPQAWQLVSQMARVNSEKQGNVLLVYPRAWQEEQERQIALRKEKQLLMLPLKNQMVKLLHADASAISASLHKEGVSLISPRGSVTVDTRTNSLLLRDTESSLRGMVRWIRTLDVPVEQVELVAHIVTIGQDKLRELGVRWGYQAEEQINNALRASQFHVDLAVSEPVVTAGFTLARMDGHLLDLELSALEQEKQVEIIASPHLYTTHQQSASIKQGTEIPYEVSSGSNGGTAMEFREAVLGMEVTPVIQGNGRILLKLHISQNVPGRLIQAGRKEIVTIDKQEIETQVSVRDGQTLALGGIFQQHRDRGRSQVPVLGSIPIIGGLFRHETTQQKNRELVIFITPRLIGE